MFTFRHKDLGDIGRIRLQGSDTNTVINLDVIGDPDDPLTARRREIFEPLGMDIANQMKSVFGAGEENAGPSPIPRQEKTMVKNMILKCEACDGYVGLLIFADNAWSPDRLEDYARMTYKEYSQMDLPTWIVGSALDNTKDAPAYYLKVWPKREPVRRYTLAEFDPIIRRLQTSHCG